MPLRIAIVAAGEMGAAVGSRLRARGATVTTCLAGRGEQSLRRARAAGMTEVPDDDALVRAADMFLSIVPPGVAEATAERIASALGRTGARLTYVDCNAVSPETVGAVARTVTSTGARFADVGIIGGPPRDGGPDPRFYVSGPEAAAFADLRDYGLDVRLIEGETGLASALKMSYGALTKGLMALAGELLVAAQLAGVDRALAAEFEDSQPELLRWITGQLPKMPPKAYRWVAEMQEVAQTFETCGLPGATVRGAAEFYTIVAGSPLGQSALRDRSKPLALDDVVESIADTCAARRGR
jgi:3-hydroxyisobutyrate dehydrogenase-like beta-hydroxyacid dehydrogenase